MNRLVLCALHRAGQPATAGDLYDMAVGLAMDEGWPRRSWSTSSIQSVAALLRGMESRGEVHRQGTRTENGRPVPLWALEHYDPDAEIPPPPAPEGTDHPLHGRTRRQTYVLFDVLDDLVATHSRQRAEADDLWRRHARELETLARQAKQHLVSAGLVED